MTKDYRDPADFGDGLEDQLEPLESLDVKSAEDFDQLFRQMRKTAFTGRNLGEAAEVLTEMVSDPDCQIVGTFSGAMTVAKMGLVLCDMIDWGWLDMIYNRIYDTLELEKNLDQAEEIIGGILDSMDTSEPLSSEIFCHHVGKWLAENTDKPGILQNAYLKGLPIYIPAFTDSELALDVGTWMTKKAMASDPALDINEAIKQVKISFNPFLDLSSYTTRVLKAKRLGIFTIGGGVPRNWAQQVSPYLEILQERCARSLSLKKFHYGVRICPEPAYWGGLSGCTYSEGVSWGKFVAPEDGGRFAEVLCDATVAWPFLVKAVKQRLDKGAR
jgi:deoxyhypusine synthase